MSGLSRRRFLAVSAATCAAGLMPGAAAAADRVRWSGVAMGAAARLTIAGLPRAEAEAALAAARAEIARLEACFSLYRSDSALCQLNRTGALSPPPLELVELLALADALHAASGGAFDPTVQPIWALLAESRGRPDPAALAAARACLGWAQVQRSSTRIAFARRGMAMTLNGIAQGYVSDRVAALLKARGMRHVLVSLGEIAALGPRPDGDPWRVGLAERGDGPVEEKIALAVGALATSAPRGTLLDPAGRVGHILDPRSGRADGAWRRVSVLNRSAALADGLSTAAVLLSEDELREALWHFPGSRLIAVDHAGRRLELLT